MDENVEEEITGSEFKRNFDPFFVMNYELFRFDFKLIRGERII